MTCSFDYHGWLSPDTIPGRETEIEPPAHGAAPEVGQPWPNFTGVEWVLADYVEPVPCVQEAQPVRLTKLAFRSRFTAAEKAAIEFAALDNPAAPTAARIAAAGLRADMADQRDARYIEITLPSTIAGVNKLAQYGLIQPHRPAEILSTTVNQSELWEAQ